MSLSSPRPPAWASMMAVATGVPGRSLSSPPALSLSPAPTAIPGGSTVVPMRVNSSSARSPKPICLQNEGSQPCTISLPALRHTHTHTGGRLDGAATQNYCLHAMAHPPPIHQGQPLTVVCKGGRMSGAKCWYLSSCEQWLLPLLKVMLQL